MLKRAAMKLEQIADLAIRANQKRAMTQNRVDVKVQQFHEDIESMSPATNKSNGSLESENGSP